jgi:hypothetical protein
VQVSQGLDQVEGQIRQSSAALRVQLVQLRATQPPAAESPARIAELTLRARGSEPQALSFLNTLAVSDPPLVFDDVTLSRLGDGSEIMLDVKARLVCAWA